MVVHLGRELFREGRVEGERGEGGADVWLPHAVRWVVVRRAQAKDASWLEDADTLCESRLVDPESRLLRVGVALHTFDSIVGPWNEVEAHRDRDMGEFTVREPGILLDALGF